MSRTKIIAQAISLFLALAPIARGDEASSLSTALRAPAAGDWGAARSAGQGAGIGGDVITWQYLRAGKGQLSEYEDFLARHPDWPGLPFLREAGEAALARDGDPARVLAYFAADLPRSGTGSAALVRALAALGRLDEARSEARRGWLNLKFDEAAEAQMLEIAAAVLAGHHSARMDAILWDGGRGAEAARMLPRLDAGTAALARARLALQKDAADAPARVDAVPQELATDPGLAFDRFDYRMRADRYDDAAELILQRSPNGLGNPQAWAGRRADLARILMRAGQAQTAYRVAANHGLTEGDEYVDLSFLAGFIALRHLNDPHSAHAQFAALQGAVKTPISQARAAYWLARTYEAAGQTDEARRHFTAAAQHQTAFYGLLAAERLGLPLDPALVTVGEAQPTWKTAPFAPSSVLAAARALLAAGDLSLAKRFFLHLSEGLSNPDLAALADMALRLDQPHIALLLAKAGAERGLILPRAYYPIPAYYPEDLPISRALALAISRRESEFDPAAQSKAGARGLMQLMPETAAQVAARLGTQSSADRLISDPAFNIRIGSAYLAQLADKFGPAIALIATGYNAGPSRPAKWIAEYGDPRSGAVDVVDWVETIPFTETRTYVMRVAESTVIYRARLKGAAGPVNITAELTGR